MFFYLLFSYFWILRFFLVKRHKTFFWFWFQILFFWISYTFFWFWVLVKCKNLFIFCIWFLYILFYIGYPPFIRSPPFLFGPFFILASPFYWVIKDKFIFICHPFAPALTAPITASSPRPSIVRTCKMC